MPRAGLTTQAVVAAAASLADAQGHDQVTLTAIADHFGVAVPSLYKHVGGLDDLRGRVATQAVRELGAALAAATSTPDGGGVQPLAHAYRDWAREHPGRYAATIRAPAPEEAQHLAASAEVLETVFTALSVYGIPGHDAVHAARTVRSALHGFVALEAAGGFGLPEDVETSFEVLVAAMDRALGSWNTGVARRPHGLG